ncbi:MAG: ATP-binding protein [Actinomyces succiniciruminis]|nr:ATP-binding protein [Actinomyces succiniciruminis]
MSDLLKRHAQPRVEELLEVFPAVELVGARQVGKSTLASMIATASERPTRIVTLDDAETRAAATADPRGFLRLEPEGLLVIDEFQRVPELALALKVEIDSDRSAGRYLLTGSVTTSPFQPATDSLAGRVIGTRVFGFSQGEIAGREEDFVAAVLHGALDGDYRSGMERGDYVDLLAAGSMPEAYRLPQRFRADWLDSYISRLLGRDLRELSRLSDPHRLRSLLVGLAATQGSETVIARMGSEINLSASTTASYLELLRALYLVDRLPPWTPNLLKREVGRSKYLLTDSALAMWLTRTGADTLKDLIRGGALGGQLEAFVAAELMRQRTWSAERFTLSHYRSPEGREIDLILELDDGGVIAIEVKAAASVAVADTKHLRWLHDRIGDRLKAGVVLTTDDRARSLGGPLWALPVSALWELG